MADIVARLHKIDIACRRADGSQIPLGMEINEAADEITALRAEVARLKGHCEAMVRNWKSLENAPYDKAVLIKVGHMTIVARLMPNASEDENGSCDQWVAEYEGEHPPYLLRPRRQSLPQGPRP